MERSICFILLLFCFTSVYSQSSQIPADSLRIVSGKDLFADHCSRCHIIGQQKTGPSLASVVDKRPVEWLLGFIRSSQGTITSGDPYAQHLFRNYRNMVMPDFRQLTDDQLMDILAYVKAESQSETHSYSTDSMNYYDAEILEKAQERASNTQKGETDYYNTPTKLIVPGDLPAIQMGETLFKGQCSRCHRLDKRTTGPALASVTDRRPLPWLLDFIESPKKVIKSGDDYANFLAMNYPLVMPDFDYLDQENKLAILAYIRYASGAPVTVAGVNANRVITEPESDAIITKKKISGSKPSSNQPDEEESNQFGDVIFKVVGVLFTATLIFVVILIVWKTFMLKKETEG